MGIRRRSSRPSKRQRLKPNSNTMRWLQARPEESCRIWTVRRSSEEAAFRSAIAADPGDTSAHTHLGILLEKRAKLIIALDELN